MSLSGPNLDLGLEVASGHREEKMNEGAQVLGS